MKQLLRLTILTALLLTPVALQAQNTSVFTTGLQTPTKIIRTPEGNFLTTGTGSEKNTGHVTFVERAGTHRALIAGLPSGTSAEGGSSGTNGLLLDNRTGAARRRSRTLFVLNGIGDTTRFGPRPGTEVPNPEGLASPILSSLLRVDFNADIDTLASGFTLLLADHFRLADGHEVQLTNAEGVRATFTIIADFRDIVPDARTIVRASNPFGLRQIGDLLYVIDAGRNSIVRVEIETNRTRTLVSLPPVPNSQPGPPMVDAVPTSIRLHDGGLLVTYLTGFPFPPGGARVQRIDRTTGQHAPFITGLTSAIDVLPMGEGDGADFFVLEFSTNQRENQPGRLLRFDTPGSTPTVLAGGLITPTSMVRDLSTGDLYITELGTGRIIRVQQ